MMKRVWWAELLKKLIDLVAVLFGRKHQNQQAQIDKIEDKIESQYEEIDQVTENNKNDDFEDRLDNMF